MNAFIHFTYNKYTGMRLLNMKKVCVQFCTQTKIIYEYYLKIVNIENIYAQCYKCNLIKIQTSFSTHNNIYVKNIFVQNYS